MYYYIVTYILFLCTRLFDIFMFVISSLWSQFHWYVYIHIHLFTYDNMYFRAYSRTRFPAPVLECRLSKQNVFLLHTGTQWYLSNTIQPIVDFQHFTITSLCVSDEWNCRIITRTVMEVGKRIKWGQFVQKIQYSSCISLNRVSRNKKIKRDGERKQC